jgi:hypothetical protein
MKYFILILSLLVTSVSGYDDDDRHQTGVDDRDATNSPNISQYSYLPSSRPSSQPSSSPSDEPSSPPSSQPTIYPSSVKSNYPSSSSNPSTEVSSLNQTQNPSSSPTQNSCHVDEMGFFGDVSPTDLTIAYYYQMEVQSNNDSNLILPSLETGISNLILESLFENTSCGVKKNNIFGTRKLDSIASMIVGINSNPTDVITNDECIDVKFSDSTCEIIEGRMKLYLNIDKSDENFPTIITAIKETILKIIASAMEEGSLLSTHEALLNLKFLYGGIVDESQNNEPKPGTNNIDPVTETTQLRLPLYGWVLVGVGSSLFFSFIFYRKRSSGKDDNDTNSYLACNSSNESVYSIEEELEFPRKNFPVNLNIKDEVPSFWNEV